MLRPGVSKTAKGQSISLSNISVTSQGHHLTFQGHYSDLDMSVM